MGGSKESLFFLWLLREGRDLAHSHWLTSVAEREGMVLSILACKGGEWDLLRIEVSDFVYFSLLKQIHAEMSVSSQVELAHSYYYSPKQSVGRFFHPGSFPLLDAQGSSACCWQTCYQRGSSCEKYLLMGATWPRSFTSLKVIFWGTVGTDLLEYLWNARYRATCISYILNLL